MQFPESKITDEVFDLLRDSYWSQVIYWITDFRNQKISHKLPEYISEFDLSEIDNIIDEIPDSSDYDIQVLHCLRWVENNIKYKTDQEVWKVPEYWQTVEETLGLVSGDCEDGALLLYWLCRQKGVPANRLMIFTGDVVGGGHCWLGYKSAEYPINWFFLDWCYNYNANDIPNRKVYDINKQDITGYIDDNYIKIWFAFNEKDSYREIRY